MARLGGLVPELGQVRFGDTVGFLYVWRVRMFRRWLSSTRRDAGVARALGVAASAGLISRLRVFSAWPLVTSVKSFAGESLSRPIVALCPHDAVCASLNVSRPRSVLVLVFQSLRALHQPRDPCLARLGWSVCGPYPKLISQLALIRQKVRRRL